MPSAIDKTTGTSTSVLQEGSPHRSRRASLKVLNRNIHQVVLGDQLFDAWYYSPYPDSIILPQPGDGSTAADARNGPSHGHLSGYHSSIRGQEPICPFLYVCPCCFRYTSLKQQFIQHVARHRHLRSQNLEPDQPVPQSAFKVYEWEGHAVWEIDGEREKLYCQNLSLFGKLFLEQKSVFFDTGGFKYYVLTYTKPDISTSPASATAKTRAQKQRSTSANTGEEDDSLYRTRVLGFFSKENLSWDSNNLACILIFPPFQHRQLGQLLMAVSYKLSGWEWEGGVIGGPEKPLSAMGRRSYLRFWSERIARFLMGQTADADAKRVFDNANADGNGRNRKTVLLRKEEMTVKEIGDRTGMLAEDVVAALTEMGMCNVMAPKRKKAKSSTPEVNGTASASLAHAAEIDPEELATVVIHRSKIVEWAEKNGVDLRSPVKEEGFLGEWALSDLAESDNGSQNASGEEGSDA
ncbi:uncharacterized protein A1O5_09703 [Cladophialophora psammophila CBS 110553]|uniref:histone acetyltransferase n=1 Tax=Cladophialophora psammophila CBS 110553 TaxID=1182543 RepID=W9WG08_9EURO|nr:uncharacterized protein A1O5_09703 [Cladophialophora psammophila CBS 110553]EXJ67057.1 hypothetical protein A1O5_09703 [Cladophialophora psammophila CBS 110553]